ncbi:MAG: hypoxanthine phosphoribosyltransferase [Candidatus Latescibacterota bacterium]|nr:MAG: hypoxanthine phosphoribosyltransferase [Candidatus Latescibacterota bacterium]
MTSSDRLYQPGDIILSADEIARVVARLGREITADYDGKNPVLVNLLKGGVVFLADLIRQLPIPHQIDFLSVSSYENGTNSSGSVRIVEDLSTNIAGRNVLIVEDVLDTGRTLAYILNMLEIRSPGSLEVCALLRKKSPKQAGIRVKYVGKEIPDVFVVGYGLDFNEKFRNLPYIAKFVTPE